VADWFVADCFVADWLVPDWLVPDWLVDPVRLLVEEVVAPVVVMRTLKVLVRAAWALVRTCRSRWICR
jgi:hypothetical protein